MTRESHLTRSSHLSLPHQSKGKKKAIEAVAVVAAVAQPVGRCKKNGGSCDERPFTCPAHQCRHMADSHHQPGILFTGTQANSEKAARLGMAGLICTPFARCRHCSLRPVHPLLAMLSAASASPSQLCSLCPLHALDLLRPEMHKDGPMLCGKHKQI